MQRMTAATAAAAKLACAIVTGALLTLCAPAQADWKEPWLSKDRALVIDAYEFNPIDWKEMTSDERIAGFINKASDGLPPAWSCKGLSGDDEALCKNRWWKYSVTKELYMTRRAMAKTLGLKWGAYHLGRPGNPREQADHFIDFAEPTEDDLIALDIEDNDPEQWMSLKDAEIFARQIHIRLGRYPVLYTNGSTAKWIADHKAEYPLLSRLPLWYARYRHDITGMFPTDTWPTYALWQFSSMHNCTEKKCPYRVKGAKTDIDVNVSPLTVAELKKAWPFNELIERSDDPDASMLVAERDEPAAKAAAVADAASVASKGEEKAVELAEAAEPAAEGEEIAIAAAAKTPENGSDAAALMAEVRQTAEESVATADKDDFVRAARARAKAPLGDSLAAAYGPQAGPGRAVDPLDLLSEAAEHPIKPNDWKHADAAGEKTPLTLKGDKGKLVAVPQPRPGSEAVRAAAVKPADDAETAEKSEPSALAGKIEDGEAVEEARVVEGAAESPEEGESAAQEAANADARMIPAAAKSKLLQQLVESRAEAEKAEPAAAPTEAEEPLKKSMSPVTVTSRTVLAELSKVDRRVYEAFEATR